MLDAGILVGIGILLALAFDFGNGLNDAANSVSTVVATRVLPLNTAVLLAAFFNFVAAFVFTTAVAATVAKGIVDPHGITVPIVVCGLVGSIVWVYGASWVGIPVSASHALIGGMVGSAFAAKGTELLLFNGISTVLIFIFIAPLLGFLGSFLFSSVVVKIASRFTPSQVNSYFKRLQLVSMSAYSLSHGSNDAQKTVGVISLLLFSGGFLGSELYIPWWVVIVSYSVIALGTLAGGWRVIKTMGLKLTRLRPVNGFCAETAGASVIFGSSAFGIPVSTTHVISGSITGVGVSNRFSSVRWTLARKILYAWIITIPLSAFVSGVSYLALSPFIGY